MVNIGDLWIEQPSTFGQYNFSPILHFKGVIN